MARRPEAWFPCRGGACAFARCWRARCSTSFSFSKTVKPWLLGIHVTVLILVPIRFYAFISGNFGVKCVPGFANSGAQGLDAAKTTDAYYKLPLEAQRPNDVILTTLSHNLIHMVLVGVLAFLVS